MRNTRVAYLTYDGLTDPLGQSQVLPYLVGLSIKGYEFTVISFEKPAAFSKRNAEIKSICVQNNITWIPKKYHKKPPVLSTLYDVWVMWHAVKKCYLQNSFPIIHCRSYITSLVGLRAKRKWGVKFIFDMRGFWVDERVEGGLWNLKNPMFKLIFNFFKNKEIEFLREADHIMSLTYNAKSEIESWKIDNAPITVIPTCVDLEMFDPKKVSLDDKKDLRNRLGIGNNHFVLLYLGSWGTWYLTDKMLSFFSELKNKQPHAKFMIITGDKVNLADFRWKQDVIVMHSERKKVPTFITIADAAICFVKTTFSKKASSATKIAEIIAMGVPVFTNHGWGDMNLLADNSSKSPFHSFPPEMQRDFVFLDSSYFSKGLDFSLKSAVVSYDNIYKGLLK